MKKKFPVRDHAVSPYSAFYQIALAQGNDINREYFDSLPNTEEAEAEFYINNEAALVSMFKRIRGTDITPLIQQMKAERREVS